MQFRVCWSSHVNYQHAMFLFYKICGTTTIFGVKRKVAHSALTVKHSPGLATTCSHRRLERVREDGRKKLGLVRAWTSSVYWCITIFGLFRFGPVFFTGFVAYSTTWNWPKKKSITCQKIQYMILFQKKKLKPVLILLKRRISGSHFSVTFFQHLSIEEEKLK